MNVPIRILGIATTIFWVLLVAFMVLAVYSIKDLSVDFGEPEFAVTSDGELNLALPLKVDNGGYYSLKEFHLLTVFSDAEGAEISRAETFVPVIPYGENTTIIHNVTLDPVTLFEKGAPYLFNDKDLNVSFTAGLNFEELLPALISANFTFPWGAPFYNFAVSDPSFEMVDFTQITLSVPMSFENHAFFDLAGSIRMELYDSTDSLLSESQTVLYVPGHAAYDGNMDFSIPISASDLSLDSLPTARSGHLDVYFEMGVIQYGPLVIPYG
jgi:hypothetical protein